MGLLDAPNPQDGFGHLSVASQVTKQLFAQSVNLPSPIGQGQVFPPTFITVAPPMQRSTTPRLAIWIQNGSAIVGIRLQILTSDLITGFTAAHPVFEVFDCPPNGTVGYVSDGFPHGNSFGVNLVALAAGSETGKTIQYKVYSI